MQPEVIEQSFERMASRANEIVARFYDVLFELDPRLKALFKGDMEAQRRHLIAVLVTIVQDLRNPNSLDTYLKDLGERNVGDGVSASDYPTVGEALIKAMRQTMCDDWDPKWTIQWQEAYGAIASLMQA